MRREVQDSIIILGCNKSHFHSPTKSCLNIGGLNHWAGLAPQLLVGLEPESLQGFTPMWSGALDVLRLRLGLHVLCSSMRANQYIIRNRRHLFNLSEKDNRNFIIKVTRMLCKGIYQRLSKIVIHK